MTRIITYLPQTVQYKNKSRHACLLTVKSNSEKDMNIQVFYTITEMISCRVEHFHLPAVFLFPAWIARSIRYTMGILEAGAAVLCNFNH